MAGRINKAGLQVAPVLVDFIETQALPGTGVDVDAFWTGFADLVSTMGPRGRDLLAQREELQAKIDAWHVEHRGQTFDAAAYRAFLSEIGYLVPEGPDFEIETTSVDPEIADLPGPQLVVPITNARFALNAANARWGSLYDALYGTDALGDLPQGKGYDVERGGRAIAWGRLHLDKVAPLADGSWSDVDNLNVTDGMLSPQLEDQGQFAGFIGSGDALTVLLRVNGLLIEIEVDPSPRSAPRIRQGSAISALNLRCPPSWTAKTQSPPWTRTTRC